MSPPGSWEIRTSLKNAPLFINLVVWVNQLCSFYVSEKLINHWDFKSLFVSPLHIYGLFSFFPISSLYGNWVPKCQINCPKCKYVQFCTFHRYRKYCALNIAVLRYGKPTRGVLRYFANPNQQNQHASLSNWISNLLFTSHIHCTGKVLKNFWMQNKLAEPD